MSFIHLHVHTEYSIIDGIIRLDPLLQKVAALNMPAVAITDHSNLFALIKFYRAALKAGIKPIIGSEVNIENVHDAAKPTQLLLFCQNDKGYHNLILLLSRAYLEGQKNGLPILSRAWLTPETCEGLIALSSGLEGDIGHALVANKITQAENDLKNWQSLFPNRFYIEISRTDQPHEELYIERALALAHRFKTPVVATNNVHFLETDDFEAHDARVCIHAGCVLNDAKRLRRYTPQQYFRSAEEMQALFSDIPEALLNTIEISKRCNVMLSLDQVCLPRFPVPEKNLSIEDYFVKLAKAGLEERLQFLFDTSAPDFAEARKSYDERLEDELRMIKQMGFPGYFLIVADFIAWSRAQGIPVGPGRGSGAGSLVAYALKITDLDPLKYDLLFERFLNPERISMPDLDIDFCMEGRDRVIEYVAHKYGRESVSQIITYGTMAARAVVRDVGRVLGHPYGFVDKIAKLIPFEIGMTLDHALDAEPLLQSRYDEEEEVQALIDLAKKLEGITRNVGKHAGGVVISPSKLTDFSPLYCEPDAAHIVTQFDKYDVEHVGLVKFDFLGLRTLTIIDWAVQTINIKREKQNLAPLDISQIPVDDAAAFRLLKSCQTTAVFQLESRGMKDLIKRLQPDTFEDIIALVALFRPGPLQSGMVDDFINRKHGHAPISYPHEKLIPVLKATYGVILYQEQVMQIARVLAGYSLGSADILRKAMGKKDPAEMAKQRKIFVAGALKNGVSEHRANAIFDLMEKFAGYGFNKSHSAAYALIAYRTAFLKAHYPAEMMAAVLSSDMDNTDKLVRFIEECRAMKITLLPPNINHSQYPFVVEEDKIVYGLGAIKGVGQAAVEAILESRAKDGAFLDLFDFCRRVDLRKVNKRVLEALIHSGAMDIFKESRATLLATLDKATHVAEQYLKDLEKGQTDLFGESLSDQNHAVNAYIQVEKESDRERLRGEKETLGFYLSGHPIAAYEAELANIISGRLSHIHPTREQVVMVAGIVSDLRVIQTKRGDRAVFLTLEDGSARLEVSVFTELYEKHRALLQKDQLLIMEVEIALDPYSSKTRVTTKKIMTMAEARESYAKHLLLRLPQNQEVASFISSLQAIFKESRGKCPVYIAYETKEAKALLPLGQNWHVRPTDELLRALREEWLEAEVVY